MMELRLPRENARFGNNGEFSRVANLTKGSSEKLGGHQLRRSISTQGTGVPESGGKLTGVGYFRTARVPAGFA